MTKIKPPPLESGSRVGVVAPASPAGSEAVIAAAIQHLKQLGYEPVTGRTVHTGESVLAGTDLERRADLEGIWSDPSISAVWCLRGGYGALRLLPELSYTLFAEHPKILMGFSDITALELGIWSQSKLVSFHGPVLGAMDSGFSSIQAVAMLQGLVGAGRDEAFLPWPGDQGVRNLQTFRAGKARGTLLGGNLTTLVSLLGTRFFPDLTGAVLFLEEVGEAAYRIDRMLTQLIISGVLLEVSAVMVGQCVPPPGERETDLIAVFGERLQTLHRPAGYGFPIGHIQNQWTLPQGVEAEVDTGNGRVVLLENPLGCG